MNTGSMQMSGLQHQHIRAQGMLGNMGNSQQGMGQTMGQGQVMSQQSPIAQMGNLNQQMMNHLQQQQQQQAIMHQNSNQVCFYPLTFYKEESSYRDDRKHDIDKYDYRI